MTPRKRYEADVPSIPGQVLIELRILTPHLPFLLQGFVPSWRHVFDMGHTDRSFAVHGPGQSGMAPLRAVLVFRTISPSCALVTSSGQLGSPHYDDLVLRHLEADLHPLLLLPRHQLTQRTRVSGITRLLP